jgi:hypothetical protein
MRRALAVAAAMLAVLLAAGGQPARSNPAPRGVGVHWQPDYDKKTITVTVDLDFFSNCTNDTCKQATEVAAQNIVNAILADWNGHKFKCWPFIVKINSHVVDNVKDVPAKDIPIGLNWSPSGPVRAYTTSDESFTPVNGDLPGDGPRPVNNPDDPSSWPADGMPSDYTHEFGHILGLDDSYDVNAPTNDQGLLQPVLVPGQTDDAMFAANPATAHLVSEQMIEQAVDRSGQVDTSKVKCNMSIDSGPSEINLILVELHGLTVHLYACDYDLPTSDKRKPHKPLHFKGTWAGAGSEVLVGGGSVSVPVEFDADIGTGGGTLSFDVHSNGHSLTMSAHVVWGNDGLLHFTEPWNINGATTAILSPPLEGTVTDKATECGQ